MSKTTYFSLIILSCFYISTVQSAADIQDIHYHLKNPSTGCLHGKKIVLSVNVAPNYDVPSTGAGDCLLYPRILREKLISLGASDVALDLGSYTWLAPFFTKCSDIPLFSVMSSDEQMNYVHVEVRDALDTMPDLSTFVSTSRFFPQTESCTWAHQEISAIADNLLNSQTLAVEETGIKSIPVLFTRQSASYDLKDATPEEVALFDYLNHRSISREELATIAQRAPKHINIFNLQFEDQNFEDIQGTQKPVRIYEAYPVRQGAFVNDAILMAAVIRVGGQIVSIDSAPLNLAMGIPDAADTNLSIKALLAKHHNSRWRDPFLKDNRFSSWSPNVELLVQETADDWSGVSQPLVQSWNRLQ